jgi:hypothetical protein
MACDYDFATSIFFHNPRDIDGRIYNQWIRRRPWDNRRRWYVDSTVCRYTTSSDKITVKWIKPKNASTCIIPIKVDPNWVWIPVYILIGMRVYNGRYIAIQPQWIYPK